MPAISAPTTRKPRSFEERGFKADGVPVLQAERLLEGGDAATGDGDLFFLTL